MNMPIRILLQTTIPRIEDDWHIGRFGLLRTFLADLAGDDGVPLFAVTARDRAPLGQPDPVMSRLDESCALRDCGGRALRRRSISASRQEG